MKNPRGSPTAADKSSSVPVQLLAGSGWVVVVVLVDGALVVVLSATVVSLTAIDVDTASSEPPDEQLARVNIDARQRMRTEVEANILRP
jgi:hypothetical protein